MKTISDYSIYCTEAQTKRALELGAPIEIGYHQDDFDNAIKIKSLSFAKIPTVEQMIGWLEEQDIFISINHIGAGYSSWLKTISTNKNISENLGYVFTHKEATLAAIDAALEYLIRHNLTK